MHGTAVYGVIQANNQCRQSHLKEGFKGWCAPSCFVRITSEVLMITRVLQIMALMTALALPALCQSGQLSPQDQHEFDKAYAKWVNDTRKNDRDDIAKDVRKMQDIMARYNIPPDEPFDRIASMGNSQYNNNYNDNNYNNGQAYSQNSQSRLSPEDQRDF